MFRGLLLAFGTFLGLWGVALLFVDQIVLTTKSEAKPVVSTAEPASEPKAASTWEAISGLQTNAENQQVLKPPQWVAFSLMSFGSVATLYSLALPKKKKG